MKKLILLMSLSLFVFASNPKEEYYIYNLYNNKFQAVFPGNPSIQQIPKGLLDPKMIEKSLPYEYKKQLSQSQIDKIVSDTILQFRNNQPYIYVNQNRKVWFKVQSMPSNLKKQNYIWKGIKGTIDKIIKTGLVSDKRTITNFKSTLDKYKNMYISKYTSYYFLDGQKVYSTTKHIYYKDKVYKWTISYVNKSDKRIFDDYENNVKVL